MFVLNRISVCFTVVIVTLIISSNAFIDGTPTYVFPTRWQASVGGWVSDGYVNHQRASSNGFIFVDYSVPVMRVDEVWNVTSIYGTPLWYDGMLSDTHLFFGDKGYIWWTNQYGPQCNVTPTGLIPQSGFNCDKCYVGTTMFHGIHSYEFKTASYPRMTLYVAIETNVPLGLFVAPIGKFFDGSMLTFVDFTEVNEFPPLLFNTPYWCSNKNSSTIHH